MSTVESFRDLIAWQKAMDLVVDVYDRTRNLPPDERFGLCAQLRRCAVGIPSNIAEGFGRHGTQEYVRFLRIARGSLFELETQAEICQRLEYDGDWGRIRSAADELRRILHGLIRSLNERIGSTQSSPPTPHH